MISAQFQVPHLAEQTLFDIQTSREWLAIAEAAGYLKITPNALRIMVHRGQVKAHKLRSRLRFRIADLKALIQSKD